MYSNTHIAHYTKQTKQAMGKKKHVYKLEV